MSSPFEDPGYRFATVKYLGDGTTVDFEYSFAGGYISKDHVLVSLRDNLTRDEEGVDPSNYTLVGTNQVHLEGSFRVPVTKTLIIRRWTPKDVPLQDFQDGSILNEYNLNQSVRQAIFSVAEMVDLFWEMIDLFWSVFDDVRQVLDIIQQLQDIVNNLNDRVDNMEVQITNILSRLDDIENSLLDIIDRLENLENAGFLTDAPHDGVKYGRQDGNWVSVIEGGGGGIDDAPSDGKLYGRQNEDWAEVDFDQVREDILDDVLNLTKVRTLEISVSGLFDVAGEEVFRLPISESCTATWPDNAAGNAPVRASLAVAPTDAFSLTVRKNGNQVGKINFTSLAVSGSWDNTISSTVNFDAGDIISVTVDSADTTASGLGISMTGIVIN